MKKLFIVIAAISFAFISCVKETIGVTEETKEVEKEFIIRGIGENAQTKTNYTDNGTSYLFSWVANDKIAVQMVKIEDGSYDSSGFVANTVNGATADFAATGNASFDVGEYAFYPLSSSTPNYFQYGGKWIYYGADQTDLSYLKNGTAYSPDQAASVTTPTVRLYETITENSEYPMRHIPMIGKKGNDGNFHFKAATGVLKVTFTGLPATASQIHLDASGYALNGYFVFDTNCEIKESYKTEGSGKKYMNFTPNSSTTRDFYFPIPSGTISAGTLTISVTDGTNTLYSVTNKVAITLTRGEITELPTITVNPVSVSFSGTATQPVIDMTFPAGQILKFGITNSTTAPAAYEGGAMFSSQQSWQMANSYMPTSSGLWYFHYTTYKGSIAKASGCIPFYFLTSSDASNLIGQLNVGYTNASITFPDEAKTLTLDVSDDLAKGNIMLTEFMGIHSDSSKNDETILTYAIYGSESAYTTITQGVGPIYGKLSGSVLTFENTLNQPISKDRFGDNNFLHNYYANQPNLAFTLGQNNHTIASNAGTISFAYGSDYPSDEYQNYFWIRGLYADKQ